MIDNMKQFMLSIVFCAVSVSAWSQIAVSGMVTEATSGFGIPGANVVVKGTSTGTATDFDGNWTLTVPNENSVLVISSIGMKTVEVAAKNAKKIVLEEDSQMLDEVVITGYTTMDRKLFTGASDNLKMAEVKLEGVPDISRALEGASAGVSVQNVSGTFGASPIITIRGNSSINGTNKPLWVIDGIVQEDLINISADDLSSGNLNSILTSGVAGLNQEDIENIQILKDVSATAIYGAQAMNGVVVITTKKGKIGKPKINYSVSTSVRERPRAENFDILDSGAEMQIYREYLRKGTYPITILRTNENYGVLGKMYERIVNNTLPLTQEATLNENYLEYYANANTDWFDVLFNNSITTQHSLSVSGGAENATYYASLGYYKDNGATVIDNVDNYTTMLNAQFTLSDRVKAGLIVNGNYRNQRVPGTREREFDPLTGQYNRDFDINPFSYALNTSRAMTPYDENGDLQFYQSNFAPFNILHELQHNFVDIGVTDISAKLNLDYSIKDNLSAKFFLSGRLANTLTEYKIHENSNAAEAYRAGTEFGVSGEIESIRDANRFLMKDIDDPNVDPYSILPTGGFYNTEENTLTSYNFRTLLEWSPEIGEKSRGNLLGGTEVKYTNREFRRNDGYGILYDRGGIVNTHPDVIKYLSDNGLEQFEYTEFRDRFVGNFIDAKYDYDGKYILGGTFRYDGSNRLGNTKRAKWLPSWNVSGAWNVHKENFMASANAINTLKLKATYGLTGTMGPDASAVLTLYGGTPLRPGYANTETGIYIDDIENQDLTWEKLNELNLGFELGLFSNKIYTEFNYYDRKSTDLIDYITTAGIGGIGVKYGNIGTMKSSGVELTLRTKNITTNNFSWETQLTYNYHQSEITELDAYSEFANAVVGTGAAQVGRPHRGLYSVRFAGLDSNGLPTFYDNENNIVQDMDLQQRENMEDWLVYEGPVAPKGQGGFKNDFKFKNWTLGVNIIYKYGNKIRLGDLYPTDVYGISAYDYRAFSKDLINRWVLPGDEYITNVPAILDTKTIELLNGQNAYSLYNNSDQRVADGDFIRLKDINIAYNLPKVWLANTGIESMRLAFNVNNIALLYSDSALNGVDPEFYNSGGVALPNQRMYTFTLNLNF
ncbi:MAG: SusC/RagA family TonB-linked outer membrane protein [Flavobacteriaceae bacterium]